MDNSVLTCADKIIYLCEELKALLSVNGAFDSYRAMLLGKLQRLSLEIGMDDERDDGMKEAFADALKGSWITTEDGHKLHIGESGEPDKGNPHVIEAISGALAKSSSREEAIKNYPRKGDMVCEEKVSFDKPGSITKDKMGRNVTHFSHDEDTMKITRPIKVKDSLGRSFRISPEPIEHLTIFAADKVGRGLDAAKGLSEQVGGSPESWKHSKGIGTVIDKDGNKRKADLHWFESPEGGQVEWKIKQFVDDMREEDKYWMGGDRNGK